jgi:hypothetical protein
MAVPNLRADDETSPPNRSLEESMAEPGLRFHFKHDFISVEFQVVPTKSLIVIQVSGEVRYRDLSGILDQIQGHPDYSPRMNGVVDLREAYVLMSPEEVEQLAQRTTQLGFSSERWAYLTDSPLATALSILYREHIAEVHEGEVFSTVAAASEYLGINLHPYLAETI